MAEWDTTSVVKSSDDSVWVKVTAIDDDDLTSEKAVDNPFGIDNESPWVEEWSRTPDDITEDSSGKLRVSVLVSDGDGSGPAKNAPQLDYHIGEETDYRGYKAMTMESENKWRYDILEPSGAWDRYRGEHIYYRVKLVDAVENEVVSDEQMEAIDNIDDPSVVFISSRFAAWENGILTIDAEVSDVDSTIASVQFYYSLDRSAWISMAIPDSSAPYSINWDTAEAIPETVKAVWVKAVATDNGGHTAEYMLPQSFGVDNQPPVISHDCDGLWNNEDFVIKLQADDNEGSGVSSLSYILNKEGEQEHEIGDQGNVSVMISTEGADNTLEYWCADKIGNEGKRETLSAIKLDKTKPAFSNWQKAADLSEDSSGSFRVSVSITDSGGSGLGDEAPQLSYHIGSGDQNDSHEDMMTEDGNVWYCNIPEPSDTWGAHANEYIYYRAIVQDLAGNSRESLQQTELIDIDNDPPEITSEPVTKATEGYLYTYDVEATDPDADSVLTYYLVTSPEGMEIDSSTGVVRWVPLSSQTGDNAVSVKVSDENGASDIQSFTISVDKRTVVDIGEMVLIPAGEFQMGSNEGEDKEKPVHTVRLNAFYMDLYEITNAQYAKFIGATGYRVPTYWNDTRYNVSDHPVVGVTWNDAMAYCEWAGKRLPTEAEWEYAARGGLVGKKYPGGDTITHDDANYSGTAGRDTWGESASVGSFAPNGYGIYDMAGNVWEWCYDWRDDSYYEKSPKENPTGPGSGTYRTARGGSFTSSSSSLRVAYRAGGTPTESNRHMGFRCAEGGIGDENFSPEITSEAITMAKEDELYSYDVDATDPDLGDILIYSLVDFPKGMIIDRSTGVISWVPTNSDVGDHDVEVMVSDENNDNDTQSFTIAVIGVSETPMILIPAGEFQMGDHFNEGLGDELPVHTVYLDAFYIDKYEVTNALYKKFMDATGHKAPRYWNDSKYNGPDHPVVGVSWEDAKAYADWTGKRLPTEAEWEKAARGGLEGKKYPLGDSLTHDDANYSGAGGKDGWEYTAPVGSFAPNGYGLYDMAGNVWEWCSDWYDENYYANSPKSNPTGPDSGTLRVDRGGSWYSTPYLLRVAGRDSGVPTNSSTSFGFRCADGEIGDENFSPEITSAAVTEATESELYSYDVDATDLDVGDILTYSLATSPPGMNIDSSTGEINWIPTNFQVGDNDVVVSVSDGNGGSDAQSFTLVVINVNDPPEITSTAITTAAEDAVYGYDVDATDPDVGDVLTYSLTTSPSGMSIDSSTGEFSWIPTNFQVGDNDVVVSVSDGNGGSDTQSFTIAVIDVSETPMVLIPAGEFEMGDPSGEGDSDELPVHTVYLDDFYIDKYEVTNSQYAAFLNSYGENTDSSGKILLGIGDAECLIEQSGGSYRAKPGYETHPVIRVTWNGAKAYAEFYGKRLPTEAEWEKSARGGLVGKLYPWGNVISHDDANYAGTGGRDTWSGTSPVGSFAPNGYGLYDMAGNVWDWCADWHDGDYYSSSPDSNPKGPSSGKKRVLRGGSWYYYGIYLQCASRSFEVPNKADFRYGFRCAAGEVGKENFSPEITSTAVTEATEDELYSYDVDATDPDAGNVLTYSLTSSPSGMSISSATGIISWTPTNTHVGNNGVTVEVSDDNGGIDSQNFTIAVAGSTIPVTEDMVLIPAGEFQMGDSFSEGDSNELPVHPVYVDAFYIDRYEVTNAMYSVFMDATGYRTPNYWDDSKFNAPDHPVVGVSWYDAVAYCEWAGKRLPTEAEREKAARGGLVDMRYPWGNTLTHDDANYLGTGGRDVWNGTAPVGSFGPNGYGLYDMAGNVSEWCADWYSAGYYSVSPKQNPAGPDQGDLRVVRGLPWNSPDLRVAYRENDVATKIRLNNGGFRCVAAGVPAKVNNPPEIISIAVTEATEGELYSYDVNATDPDMGETITYSLINFPTGMVIDEFTGVISWVPTNADVGEHDVEVMVSDESNDTDTQSFMVVVINVNDPPEEYWQEMVACWPMNEGRGDYVEDVSGNGNDGDILGGVEWVKGIKGTALEFDGISGWVDCGTDTSLYTTKKQCTLMFWFKPTADINPGDPRQNPVYHAGAPMFGFNATGDWNVEEKPGALMAWTEGPGEAAQTILNSKRTSWKKGEWHHAACVYDGSEFRLYVDGNLEDMRPGEGEIDVYPNQLFAIGADSITRDGTAASLFYFKGVIDEVKYWRRPLSRQEILEFDLY